MNVLITGGAGYIGTELTYALNANPDIESIVIYDNLNRQNFNVFLGRSKLEGNKVRYVNGDILDSRKLKKEIEKADIVYHLAAKVTTPFADHSPHEFDQVNNWGTAELTYLIEESNVSKLIYASSASVYGASSEAVDVDTSPNPRTFYGISKMRGEDHVKRLIGSKTDVYILRLGNVYGYSKSMRFDSVINKFLFEANFAKRIRIYGSGEQKRSFIHIDRLAALLNACCAEKNKQAPGIYNLVESTYAIHDITDALKMLYPEMEMIFVNQNVQMRSLKVKPDDRLNTNTLKLDADLLEDLKEFKDQFCF